MSDPNSEDDFLDLCDDSSPSPPVFKTQAKNTKSSDVKPLPFVNETETNTNQHSASGSSIQNLETNTKLPSASRSSNTFFETNTKHPSGSRGFNVQSDNASDLEDYSDIESDESVVCMAGYKLESDAQNSSKTSTDKVDTKEKTKCTVVTISDESDSDANGSGKVIDISSDHESGCKNQKRNSNDNLCTSTLKRTHTTGITKSDTNLDITPPKRIRSEATGHPVNVQVNDLWDTQTYISYAEAKEQYLQRQREDYAQRKLEEKANTAAKTKSKVNDHSIRSKDSEKSFSEQVNGAWETDVQPKFSYARTKEEYLQRQRQDYAQRKLEEKNQTKFSNASTTEKSAHRQREDDAQIKMKEQTNTSASAVNDNITTHKKSESEDNAVDVKVKDSDDQSETDKTRNRKQRLQKEVEEYAMIKLREMFPNTDEKEIRDRVTSENSDGTLTDTSIVERVVEIILGSTDEISDNVGQDVQIAIANPRLQVSQDSESKAVNPKAKNQMTNDRKGKGLMKKVPKDDTDYDMETDSVYSQEFPEVNPSPVTKPDLVVRTGDNSVRLRWKHIDTNLFPSYDVHTRYMVEMQAPPCDTWKVIAKNIAGLVYEVQDLKPFQDYQFRVRAVTRYGDMSEPSPVAVLCRSLVHAKRGGIDKRFVKLKDGGDKFIIGHTYLVSGSAGLNKKMKFDGHHFVDETIDEEFKSNAQQSSEINPFSQFSESGIDKKLVKSTDGGDQFIIGHTYLVSGPGCLGKKMKFNGHCFVDKHNSNGQQSSEINSFPTFSESGIDKKLVKSTDGGDQFIIGHTYLVSGPGCLGKKMKFNGDRFVDEPIDMIDKHYSNAQQSSEINPFSQFSESGIDKKLVKSTDGGDQFIIGHTYLVSGPGCLGKKMKFNGHRFVDKHNSNGQQSSEINSFPTFSESGIDKKLVKSTDGGDQFIIGHTYLVSGPGCLGKKMKFNGDRFVDEPIDMIDKHYSNAQQSSEINSFSKFSESGIDKKLVKSTDGGDQFIIGHTYLVSGPDGMKKKMKFNGHCFVDKHNSNGQQSSEINSFPRFCERGIDKKLVKSTDGGDQFIIGHTYLVSGPGCLGKKMKFNGDRFVDEPIDMIDKHYCLIPAQTSNDHNSPSINKNLVLNKNGNHFKKGYEYLVSGPDGKPKKYYFDGEKFVVPKTFVTVTHTYSCEEDLTDPKATKVETTKSVFSLNKKFIEGANGKSDFIKGHSYMVSGPNGLKKKLIFDGKKFVDPDPNESQHNITSSSQNTSCTTNTNHPKVEDMECFHGNISRHLAEQLLCHRENGIYLVRETNKGRKALSVVCDGHVSHYMIQLDESDNKVYFEHNVKFDTVSELLQHYTDNFGLSTKLKNFVPRIPKDPGSDRLEHVTLAATNEEVTSTTLACEACLSTITTDKIVQCCDGHLNCSSCVEKVVKKVLSNESEEAQISCSYSINKKQDCTSYIPESQAKKVLPKLVFELLEEKLAKKASEAIDKMTDIYSCPSCQMKVVIEGDMKKFTCPQCKTVTCRYCNKPWSTGCHDKCTMHILMVNSEEMETSNSDWCTVPEGHRDFAAVELDHTNSREFQFVCSLFRGKKDRVGCLNRVNKVFRINNPRLWQKFRLAKEHMMEDIGIENINEQHLFHGTGTSAVGGICRDGFDWRLCGANATVYGDGSYFAKNSSYSIKYCRDSKSSSSSSSRNARIATMMSQIINSTALAQAHGGSFGGPTTSSSNSVNNPSYGPTTFHYGGSSINSASAKVAQKLGRKPSTNTISFSSVTHYPPQSNSGPSFGAQPNSGPSFGAQPNRGPSFGAQPNSGPSFVAQPNSGPNFGAPNSAQPNTGLGFGINTGLQSSNSGSNLSSVPPNLSQHLQNFLNQHQAQPAQPSGISSSGPRVFTFGALPTNPNDNSPSQPSEVPLEEKFIDKNKRYMFLGRVLVGRPCRGVHGMKKPPRDENNRPYNSASDNPDKPSIYIIFDSAQCYPEYLIEFQ